MTPSTVKSCAVEIIRTQCEHSIFHGLIRLYFTICRSVPANASDALYCMLLSQSAVHGAMVGYTGKYYSVYRVSNYHDGYAVRYSLFFNLNKYNITEFEVCCPVFFFFISGFSVGLINNRMVYIPIPLLGAIFTITCTLQYTIN